MLNFTYYAPIKRVTNLYTKILKLWFIMTDKVDLIEQKMTDWFDRRSKRTQCILNSIAIWILFFTLPFIVLYCMLTDEYKDFSIKEYIGELYNAYRTDFWEFRIEMKARLKEYQQVNTKLHRALK